MVQKLGTGTVCKLLVILSGKEILAEVMAVTPTHGLPAKSKHLKRKRQVAVLSFPSLSLVHYIYC